MMTGALTGAAEKSEEEDAVLVVDVAFMVTPWRLDPIGSGNTL
jgi:hypothetical protein